MPSAAMVRFELLHVSEDLNRFLICVLVNRVVPDNFEQLPFVFWFLASVLVIVFALVSWVSMSRLPVHPALLTI